MRLRRLVSAVCCASLLLTTSLLADRFHEQRAVPLHAAGIAIDSTARTAEIASAGEVYPDARAVRGAGSERAGRLGWPASGSVPDVAYLHRILGLAAPDGLDRTADDLERTIVETFEPRGHHTAAAR